MSNSFAESRAANPEPSLQELVAQHGGYDRIPAEAWTDFDRRRKEWQDHLRWRHLDDKRGRS